MSHTPTQGGHAARVHAAPPLDASELRAWLRLSLTPGVGDQTARKLLAHFGLPQQLFEAPEHELRSLLTPLQVSALLQEPPGLQAQVTRTMAWLDSADECVQRRVVPLGDALYPDGLLNMADPPLLLYLMGRLDWPLTHAVAVVGSRNPTPQGAINARLFSQALTQAGVCVVSGLALGVDGAAHEGALEGVREGALPNRLTTVAVVGTGLDRVYPRAHHALAHRIAQLGWVVSEYPIGTPPLAANFPKRNRLIAGLSQATLVVEAALKSGSLITARLALEQGKEVMAIPGSIHATQARGCHALIRQGAKLVESAQDVLEDLQLAPRLSDSLQDAPDENDKNKTGSDRTDESDQSLHRENPLLQAMGWAPISLDDLQALTGLAIGPLQAQLMALELDGEVTRMPGGLLQRIARG
jgi:DNA processing protein